MADDALTVPPWLRQAAAERAEEWVGWLALRKADQLHSSFPNGKGYLEVHGCARPVEDLVAGLETLLGPADGADPWGWDLPGYGIEVFRKNPLAKPEVEPDEVSSFLQVSWWIPTPE